MSDLASLHRRLRRALDVSSLLVLGALAPACASTQEQDSEAQTKAESTKTADAKVGDGKTARSDDGPPVDPPPPDPPPPDPEDMRLPPCPTGKWCGPRALVEPMRRTDLAQPPADVEGCPGAIAGSNEVDPKAFEEHEGLPLGGEMLADVDAEATKAKRAAGDADTCCYNWMEMCPGGRPLLIDGRPWIAGLRAGHRWAAQLPEPPLATELPPAARERIAEGWLRDALTEHASIASFARAREELGAIGAPSALLEACERAAEDEVEHARLCFGLAERYGGRALEPTALPEVTPRCADPLAVALDTFVEGCVGETIAAACARRAAGEATDPVVRAVLERIADDETEHAALAWRTVAWLSRREGPRVLAALIGLAERMRPPATSLPAASPDAPWLLAHGRLDRRALAQTQAQAWRELIDPLLGELGARADEPQPDARARPS